MGSDAPAATTTATRVVVVDDSTLTRDCLAVLLAPHYDDVRGASDLPTMVKEVGSSDGNTLVLLNIATHRGPTLLQIALDLSPTPKVIVYGLSEDHERDILACAESGAAGLHLRSESFEHLLDLMQDVSDGRARCSSAVSAILLGRIYIEAAGYQDPGTGSLTVRESEILALLEEGLTNKQIAVRLSVTVHTVKNHVHSLLGKLGVQSRAEATRLSRAARYAGQTASAGELPARHPLNRALNNVH